MAKGGKMLQLQAFMSLSQWWLSGFSRHVAVVPRAGQLLPRGGGCALGRRCLPAYGSL